MEMAFLIWSVGMPVPPWSTSGRSPTSALIIASWSKDRPSQSAG